MAIECLQRFVETNCPSACVPVDLVKIARTVAFSNISPRGPADFRFPYDYPDYYYQNPLCLVIDGECCLDRLYGGFFGDWVCGGQWNRMVDFLTTFFQTVSSSNIEITVFLNGASEPHRMENWIEKQKADKEKISQVLRHVTVKGTPPPKVWWIPPSCLRSCLRMVLRHLNVNVVLTTNDHHQEVMAYIRKHNYHGLLADDSEYIVFDPPRYFSSVQLKLTFKGCLETRECILNEVTRCLNLHPSRICIVAALLGNHIITDSDLLPFHKSLCPDVKGKIPPNNLIKSVVEFVRNLPSVDDLDTVAQQVFGPNSSEKCEKLKQCVLYYVKGNKNAAARFQSSSSGNHPANIAGSHPGNVPLTGQQSAVNRAQKSPLLPTPGSTGEANAMLQNQSATDSSPKSANNNTTCISSHMKDEDMESGKEGSKFASETLESERSSLQAYRQVLGKTKHGSAFTILSNQEERDCDGLASNFSSMGGGDSPMMSNHKDFLQNSVGSDCGEGTSLETPMSQMNLNSKSKNKKSPSKPLLDVPLLPKVPTEVMRMARERHQRGLMSPSIFQVLSQGEIKIPVLFEDEIARELPSPSHLYRPLRQMVYALLFNQHHLQYLAEQKKDKEGTEEKVPEIIIKEWVWSKGNKYNRPDLVPSQPLGWAVPTVTRLWFGSGPEDNKRRLQAFLTCMRSNSPLMCNTSYVPQHYMILCCVLRYIMTNPDTPVLRKHELDAFLVQAVDPHLTDVEHTQKLELPLVTPRGIQLAALFMQGVENALFANDACGAPIPWLMCCPWLFFDGKIFHRKLLKANGAKNLIDLCDNHIDEVAKVERMRAAIMEGVQIQFAHPPLVPVGQRPPPPPPFPNFPVPVPGGMTAGRGRGHQRVVPRGGQLEVAGVVVGSWGPNFGQGPRSPTRNIPPQVVSVGGAARGRGGNNAAGVGRGGIPPGRTPILPITKPGGVPNY